MMLQEGGVKIWRPRQVGTQASILEVWMFLGLTTLFQIYVGPGKRDYVSVDERESVEGLKKTPSPVSHSG